jgi:LysM repeat protein
MPLGLSRSMSLRMLAPASLALFAIVFLIVIVASLDSGSSDRPDRAATGSERQATAPAKRSTPLAERRTYVVKAGDTLSKIAAKTGVEIERLLALNPTVDPQGLVAGQRIKLRE